MSHYSNTRKYRMSTHNLEQICRNVAVNPDFTDKLYDYLISHDFIIPYELAPRRVTAGYTKILILEKFTMPKQSALIQIPNDDVSDFDKRYKRLCSPKESISNTVGLFSGLLFEVASCIAPSMINEDMSSLGLITGWVGFGIGFVTGTVLTKMSEFGIYKVRRNNFARRYKTYIRKSSPIPYDPEIIDIATSQ